MPHVLAKDLRDSVLQAAFEGKISNRLLSDTPVYKTLEHISDLKKKNKIKDPKSLKNDFDYPFDIPEEWRWVKLQEIIDVRDGTHDSPRYVSKGYPFVTSKNLINGRLSFENVKYIDEKDFLKFNERSRVDNNDILMAMIGSIGKPVWVENKDREFSIKNVALLKHIPESKIEMKFILYLMNYAESNMKSQATGGVQQFVSLDFLRNYPVPLPPIEEQDRIVARVDELMAKIDEYEKIEKELTELQKAFPGNMKDAILQAAMQGKLINHFWSEDDTPEIYKHLWEVTIWDKRFKGVHKMKQPKIADYNSVLARDFPSLENTNGDVLLLSTGKYVGYTSEEKLGYQIKPAEIVSLPGGGSPEGMKYYSGKFVSTDNRIGCSNDIEVLNNKYLYYFLLSEKNVLETMYRGIGIKHPDMSSIIELMIPLPSIEEQHRIVDKLDRLLPLCEGLEAMI